MRSISDDEQIVEDRHDKDNKDEQLQDESEEKDDEPGEEEDEESPWVGIQDEVEELQKEKLEALIAEFQKSVRFTESGSC